MHGIILWYHHTLLQADSSEFNSSFETRSCKAPRGLIMSGPERSVSAWLRECSRPYILIDLVLGRWLGLVPRYHFIWDALCIPVSSEHSRPMEINDHNIITCKSNQAEYMTHSLYWITQLVLFYIIHLQERFETE